MDYSADKPISSSKDDLLNRSIFSKQLGKSLCEYKGKDGLVIGLYGKWGTGKTSVLNMAIEEIENLDNDSQKPIIIKFSPWNYTDKDNLISIFFKVLDNKINGGANNKYNKVGSALKKYANVVDILNVVPVFNAATPILKTIMEATGTYFSDIDLDTTKKDLEEALVEVEQRIIIVIDDIDRLTNSQIRDVFQLVKQLADFPYVTYVLLMDRDIVTRALLDVHNIDGDEYLDKIVQIPFEIPMLSNLQLEKIFIDKLEQCVVHADIKASINKDYWGNVFFKCVLPYVNTLRDINRVINLFKFKYEVMCRETCIEDLIAITTIEVKEPKLYDWIKNNKSTLLNEFEFPHIFEENADWLKYYLDVFENIGCDSRKAISFISTLFPKFAEKINDFRYTSYNMYDNRANLRISSSKNFQLYFMYNIDTVTIQRDTLEKFINDMDALELKDYMVSMNHQGLIEDLLKEIVYFIDSMSDKRTELILRVLLNFKGLILDKKADNDIDSFGGFSKSDIFDHIIINLLRRIEDVKKRFSLVQDALKEADITNIDRLASLIHKIEFSYGRLLSDEENEFNQVITEKQLEKIEKLYVNTISKLSNLSGFIDIQDFFIVFYLWECFDKQGASEYINQLFTNNIYKLKFICRFAHEVRFDNGKGWKLHYEEISEYISKEKIHEVISNLDKGRLNEFTDLEQIQLASIFLRLEAKDYSTISEEEALELVEEWKQSIDY